MRHTYAPTRKSVRRDRPTRAMMLWARLNQQRMNYTPLSHRGQRARRLISLLVPIIRGEA